MAFQSNRSSSRVNGFDHSKPPQIPPLPLEYQRKPRRSFSAEEIIAVRERKQDVSRPPGRKTDPQLTPKHNHHSRGASPESRLLPQIPIVSSPIGPLSPLSANSTLSVRTPYSANVQLPGIKSSSTTSPSSPLLPHTSDPKSRRLSHQYQTYATSSSGSQSGGEITLREHFRHPYGYSTPSPTAGSPSSYIGASITRSASTSATRLTKMPGDTSPSHTQPTHRTPVTPRTGSGSESGNPPGMSAQRIDMKRLMSKPATTTGSTSGASILSIPLSDPEPSEDMRRKQREAMKNSHVPPPPVVQSRDGDRGVEPVSSRTPIRSRATSAEEPRDRSKGRNVLRRKPSGQDGKHPLPPSTSRNANPSITVGAVSGEASSRAPPSPRSSPQPPLTPIDRAAQQGLTPASALAAAYRRGETATASGAASPSSTIHPFDSTSRGGKVVAMGDPTDDSYDLPWKEDRLQHSTSSNGLRSLSRKVSSKFKSSKNEDREKDRAKEHPESPRRIEMRRSVTNPEGTDKRDHDAYGVESRNSWRPSDESYVDLAQRGADVSVLPSAWNGHRRPSPVLDRGRDRAREKPRSVRGKSPARSNQFSDPPPSIQHQEEGGLWRLVKKLSSGTLREKARPLADGPPPVPPLPRGSSTDYPRSRKTSFRLEDEPLPQSTPPEVGGISRFISSRPSLSTTRPVRQTPPAVPRVSTSSAAPAIRSTSASQSRTETSLRSSSPSENTSSTFFNRGQSPRTSTSSYGEELPPPVPPVYGKHIIPPEDLPRFEHPMRRTRSGGPSKRPDDLHSTSPSFSQPNSLVLPPSRRSLGSRVSSERMRDKTYVRPPSPPLPSRSRMKLRTPSPCSPTIPTFSNSDTVYTTSAPLSPRRTGTTPTTHAFPGPPPIPRRSIKRPAPTKRTGPSTPSIASSGKSDQHVQDSPRQSNDREIIDVSGYLSSLITGEAKPPSRKARPRSNSLGHSAAPPLPQSSGFSAGFRELKTTNPAPARTEKEKNDMWEELLAKSDRAGGTLQARLEGSSGAGLLSDRMRFSEAYDSE